jgi:DNA-binding HxlR family transcriptional regulator
MPVGAQAETASGSNGHVHRTTSPDAPAKAREGCCALYHHAVELIGKRWTGAILFVLTDGPLRFSEVRQLVPDLSDRLLSERLKELEAEGIVERRVIDEMPVRVEYTLTEKGRALEPVLRELKSWAQCWEAIPTNGSR